MNRFTIRHIILCTTALGSWMFAFEGHVMDGSIDATGIELPSEKDPESLD